MARQGIDQIISECKKFFGRCRKYEIYEAYKRKITSLNLELCEYENAVRSIAKIVGI